MKQVKDDLVKMEAAVSQAETDLNPGHGFTIRPLFFVSLRYFSVFSPYLTLKFTDFIKLNCYNYVTKLSESD